MILRVVPYYNFSQNLLQKLVSLILNGRAKLALSKEFNVPTSVVVLSILLVIIQVLLLSMLMISTCQHTKFLY